MKEIRFRAWDKKEKIMKVVNDIAFGESYRINGSSNDMELMQYTGLKDKNGKEIYEGDILKVDWGGIKDEYITINKYDKPFVVEWRGYEYPPFSRYLPMPKNIEIIGNIYENPELISTPNP